LASALRMGGTVPLGAADWHPTLNLRGRRDGSPRRHPAAELGADARLDGRGDPGARRADDRLRRSSDPLDLTGPDRYGSRSVTSMIFDMSTRLPTLPAGPAAASCCPADVGLDAGLDADRIAQIAAALSEPVRVSIVDVLRRSPVELCQCELVPLFEMPQSTLSHHLKRLVDAGLVVVERRHKWAYYSLSPDALKELTAWLS
jgi:ArsR family transcriptional regulator